MQGAEMSMFRPTLDECKRAGTHSETWHPWWLRLLRRPPICRCGYREEVERAERLAERQSGPEEVALPMTARELIDHPSLLDRIAAEYARQDAMDRRQWEGFPAPDVPKRRAHAARLVLRRLVREVDGS